MSSNFNCSYMARSSLAYIPGFFVNFSFSWFIPIRHILITFKSSLKPLNQIKANLAGMVVGWSLFNIVSDSAALHSKWLVLPKIEISLVVNFCFITNQNELKKFNCSYMAMSSLTYILGFSVRFFQPVYSI